LRIKNMLKKVWILPLLIFVTGVIYFAVQSGRKNQDSEVVKPDEKSVLALVDEIDILVLESFPVQIRATVKGNLPSPCFEIGDINEIRQYNHFTVSIKTKEVAEICAQVLTPFEESIPLSVYGLKAGRYTVEINGAMGEFTLQQDNFLDDQNDSATPLQTTPSLPPGY